MPVEDTEDLVVDIPDTGDSIDVVVEPLELDSEESGTEVPEEEHLEYSKKVKRRIDKLTKKSREMERQQAAAVDYARGMQEENNQLRTRVRDLDQGYVAEYGDRVATQADSLSRDLETAIATNDTSAQVELNKKLAQLAIEEERVRTAKQQQAAQSSQQQQQQVPARVDPRATTWAGKNAWFGEDDAMTFAAFGIHKTLIEEEGFDTESTEYYDEIDKRIKSAFPHKFNDAPSFTESRRPQQAVASATRSGSAGRKTVKLSPSEVAIANKLGVPLDQYAKYKR
tara:strand:+ start:1191 stop:2039 length:849 start_codon:yes stop_codon:yes gene_type:complete